MKKIVVVKNLKFYPDQKQRLDKLGEVTYYNDSPKTPEEWLNRCRGADIICTGIFGLKSEKLFELKDVFISLPFVGVEFLDKKRLKENKIVVSNSPGCNKEAVTEWIIGMILTHFRRLTYLIRAENMLKDEILQSATGLNNKKITILGSGQIGNELARLCKAFGMEVKFFKRGEDLLDSVKDADIIANCLSVKPDSENLLNDKFFSSLKKGSFFVSSSRSQIYDITALKSALDKGILIGAADDAASAEVGDINDPEYKKILSHPKILVTPHIAWNTDVEKRKANDMMIDNVEAYINGKPINLL